MVATPSGADSIAFNNSGISSRSSASRFDVACKTMTAIENEGRFCWNERLRSTVTNTSNFCDTKASNRPLAIPV